MREKEKDEIKKMLQNDADILVRLNLEIESLKAQIAAIKTIEDKYQYDLKL